MASRRNPGVKRILQEAKEMANDPSPEMSAAPLEDDLWTWHFTIRVPHPGFEGGIYHGRINLPNEYPLRPPDVILLTPNGRFELNKKICLTITGYHEEHWQPAWGIRTALMALIGFFESEARGAIGGIDMSQADRQRLAKVSPAWACPTCKQPNSELLPEATASEPASAPVAAAAAPPSAQSTAATAPSEAPASSRQSVEAEVQAALDAQTTPRSIPQSAAVLPSSPVASPPIPDVAAPRPLPMDAPAPAAPAPVAPQLAARAIPPPGAVILVADAPAPGQIAIPALVAPSLTPAPPTWTDRLVLATLVLSIGAAIRVIG